MTSRRLFPAFLLAATVSACSGASLVQQGPSDTLRSYAQAIRQGRVDDAYKMLSDDAKRSMSLEAFRRAVQENPQDAMEIADAIARPAGDPAITATVTMPNGDELLLVFEGGRWRIDATAVELYGQSTPRQALVGFLRAFDRKRYDVVLRYVPDAEKEGIDAPSETPPGPPEEKAKAKEKKEEGPAAKEKAKTPVQKAGALTPDKLKTAWEGPQKDQINRIVQAIKTALPNAQIEETGDSASMAYGAGGTVAFVREHGAWKIKDF